MGVFVSKAQEKSIPKGLFLSCPMTLQQNVLCKSIFFENAEKLIQHKNIKEIAKMILEVCNHPFIIRSQVKNSIVSSSNLDIINFSGKMIVLDKLLLNMNKKNKVIIISQMDKMLDILENYLKLYDYEFSRIDLSIRGKQRQNAIDSFNDEKNDFYILLLHSMAGLKGINFASANTVIIYDSDINLINEINFGHSEIYYLISNKSSEQIMLKFLIENIKKDIILKEKDYEKILRYGAYYAFNNTDEDLVSKVNEIFEENINNIIKTTKSNKLIETNENLLNLNIPNFWNYYLHDAQKRGQSLKPMHNLYFNPNNSFFSNFSKETFFVDKTKMVNIINEQFLNKIKRYICLSRPRRFGKSFIAQMLCAYYTKGSDNKEVFQTLKLAHKSTSWLDHINKYNVVFMDILQMCTMVDSNKISIQYIQSIVLDEIKRSYPSIDFHENSLSLALQKIYSFTGEKFIIIIDEWDYILNNLQDNKKLINDYVSFIVSMFKGINTANYISLAYLTGIFPIKCYDILLNTNNFYECSMINPNPFEIFFGFTEKEVKKLCLNKEPDFDSIEKWYDGYIFNGIHIYNPDSVISSLTARICQNFWSRTGNCEILGKYINLDFDGLQCAIIELLSERRYKLLPKQIQTSIDKFVDKEDVLIYLVHIGYLGYDSEKNEAFIPNLELFYEFNFSIQTIKNKRWGNVINALQKSNQLIDDTLNGKNDEVVKAISQIHTDNVPILSYNNELSLNCVLSLAYYSAIADYSIVREFQLGKGFADLSFIPKKNVNKPALIVELKWKKSAYTAIEQIESNEYHGPLSKIANGDIILVNINYDQTEKTHTCIITFLDCTKK